MYVCNMLSFTLYVVSVSYNLLQPLVMFLLSVIFVVYV